MQYTIIDSKELSGLFREARIDLQQACIKGQTTDISSMQENAAFVQVIISYVTTHDFNGKDKEMLIEELAHCLRSEISANHQFAEADYQTILRILFQKG